ncbi:MAG: hypothetical protein AAF958_11705 [Planctomycetota bacterium]
MKRLLVCLTLTALCIGGLSINQTAVATSEFNKVWKEKFLDDDANEDFKKLAKKASCNVCHIYREKKSKRNDYGDAIHKYLKKEDFKRDYVKANYEEASKKIMEGFKKAAEEKDKNGVKFSEKLKKNQLPASNANLKK